MSFAEKLVIDPAAEVARIGARSRQMLGRKLNRRGFVLFFSGPTLLLRMTMQKEPEGLNLLQK